LATIVKQKSGRWRVQVRRKGRYLGETFTLRKDAEAWARRVQRELDLGLKPVSCKIEGIQTFGELVDLHVSDMKSVGKASGRSKAFSMVSLKKQLGKIRLADLDRQTLIDFGKARAKSGAGPMTLGIDLGYIRTLLANGAAVHGLPYSPEPVDLARNALRMLGLVGKGQERDRRPTREEIERLIEYFRGLNGLTIPMGRIVGGVAGHRPQGLEDAAALHAHPPPGPSRDRRPQARGARSGLLNARTRLAAKRQEETLMRLQEPDIRLARRRARSTRHKTQPGSTCRYLPRTPTPQMAKQPILRMAGLKTCLRRAKQTLFRRGSSGLIGFDLVITPRDPKNVFGLSSLQWAELVVVLGPNCFRHHSPR
jgi:hypothetical protein